MGRTRELFDGPRKADPHRGAAGTRDTGPESGAGADPAGQERTLTVRQVLFELQRTVARSFDEIRVQGEVTSVKRWKRWVSASTNWMKP